MIGRWLSGGACALLLAGASAGAEGRSSLYVERGGDDTHDCRSSAQACRSVARAVDAAEDGAVIHIGPGTFPANLRLEKSLQLRGRSMDETRLDGSGKGRVLAVLPDVTVAVTDLTIGNGRVVGETSNKPGADGGHALGGGVHNAGVLTLKRVRVAANRALGGNGVQGKKGKSGKDGGNGHDGRDANSFRKSRGGGGGGNGKPGGTGRQGGEGGTARGGGIYNDGELALAGVILTGNRVTGGTGGRGGRGGSGGDGGDGGQGGDSSIDTCVIYHDASAGGSGGKGGNGGRGGRGGGAGRAEGGGLYNAGSISYLANALIAHNRAIAGRPGSGGSGGPQGYGGTGGQGGAGSALNSKWRFCSRPHGSNGGNGGEGEQGSPESAGSSHLSAGGGILNAGSNRAAGNLTIAMNESQLGPGLYDGGEVTRLANAIVWGNRVPTGSEPGLEVDGAKGFPQLVSSCIEVPPRLAAAYRERTGQSVAAVAGKNILDCVPRFVDPDGPDDVAGSEDDDFRLQAGSPAIDAGDRPGTPKDSLDLDDDASRAGPILVDLAGQPRFNGQLLAGSGRDLRPNVDMGAFEWISQGQEWPIGAAVVPPQRAIDPATDRPYNAPELFPSHAREWFYWDDVERKLYGLKTPARPTTITLAWQVTAAAGPRSSTRPDDPDDLFNQRVIQRGVTVWPEPAVEFVAGAPVDLQPAGENGLQFVDIPFSTAPGDRELQPTAGMLQLQDSGTYALIRYARGPLPDLTRNPPLFVVARSVQARPESSGDSCVIGSPLPPDPRHIDPSGRTGFVLNALARYDGGADGDATHDRMARSGPIVPVNLDRDGPEDDLVVAWYHTDRHGIAWPAHAVRYRCRWPQEAPTLVVAGEHGSGLLDPEIFVDASIYHQPDLARPGYNPNEEHAWIQRSGDGLRVHALRSDLNRTSQPWVLLKYRDPASGQWAFKPFRVEAESPESRFAQFGELVVGEKPIELPAQLDRTLPPCDGSTGEGEQVYREHGRPRFWAKSKGQVRMRWYYRLKERFWYDPDGDGSQQLQEDGCVPWMDRHGGADEGIGGEPVAVDYLADWPPQMAQLRVGETLLDGLQYQSSVALIHGGEETGVRLLDPFTGHRVNLAAPPVEPLPPGTDGTSALPGLPPHLAQRLRYDANARELLFRGLFLEQGEGILLPNRMTAREQDTLANLSDDPGYRLALEALYKKTRSELDTPRLVAGRKALSAGAVTATGHVTLAFNDDQSLSGADPVSLKVFEVVCPVHTGTIYSLPAENLFDESQTLRYSADFGGESERLRFEWRYLAGGHIDRVTPDATWQQFAAGIGNGTGEVDITITGATPLTLRDHSFLVRYRGYESVCGEAPSGWAGATSAVEAPVDGQVGESRAGDVPVDGESGGARPYVAEGWIKRVLGRLNLYDTPVRDFLNQDVNTRLSMLSIAGERYSPDSGVALSGNAANLNQLGLIKAYEAILRRGRRLSIDAANPQPYDLGPGGDDPLLLVASQIADLYLLLGHEAYADAADPTIPFEGAVGEVKAQTTSLFAFKNQLASLLDEELALLRGRDDVRNAVEIAPYHNRLKWNFSGARAGQLAYVRTYNITNVERDDADADAGINEADAKHLFPQGHGDAWGHYLTAIKSYYRLLRHPRYEWRPRAETVQIDGKPVAVDYLDERRFAEAALAKARSGSEIVKRTFSRQYGEGPRGRWSGFADARPERAWGLAGWGRRAGLGAYLDWVSANALLPACSPGEGTALPPQCDPDAPAIAQIHRATVPEVAQIPGYYQAIQQTLDQADQGLNPLGLVDNVVPFGINPESLELGTSHFEQIYERSLRALNNARRSFAYASEQTHALRSRESEHAELRRSVRDREIDFKHRLIEIFGTPYPGDMGAGGTYEDENYDGPDIYHYDYVDASSFPQLAVPGRVSVDIPLEVVADPARLFEGRESRLLPQVDPMKSVGGDESFDLDRSPLQAYMDLKAQPRRINFSFSPGLGFVKPADWDKQRHSPGQVQILYSEFLQSVGRLHQEVQAYRNLLAEIDDRALELIPMLTQVHARERKILTDAHDKVVKLNYKIAAAFGTHTTLDVASENLLEVARASADSQSKSIGTASDPSPFLRSAIYGIAGAKTAVMQGASVAGKITERGLELVKEELETRTQFELLAGIGRDLETLGAVKELMEIARREPYQRGNLYVHYEAALQNQQRYRASVAEGQRLLSELIRFRRETAAQIEGSRYRDMAHRVFRSEALQQYHTQFETLARYTYLTAKAYDYETGSAGPEAGASFAPQVLRQRNLGVVEEEQPVASEVGGIADVLARLSENFEVFRDRSGYDKAPVEPYGGFSLRWERFRIPLQNEQPGGEESYEMPDYSALTEELYQDPSGSGDEAGSEPDAEPEPEPEPEAVAEPVDNDERWRELLGGFRIPDLRDLPEYQAYSVPISSSRTKPQPALVIPFSTSIEEGLNVFAQELMGNEHRFPDTKSATRIFSATVVFKRYDSAELVRTPHVYLLPVGSDVTRQRDGGGAQLREWRVVDLKLPYPYRPGSDGDARRGVSRMHEPRRFRTLRAYGDEFDPEFDYYIYDQQLAGRSAWNTQWLLIIPGTSLHSDPEHGLDRLIGMDRDGNYVGEGVSDIKLFFKTYSYGSG